LEENNLADTVGGTDTVEARQGRLEYII